MLSPKPRRQLQRKRPRIIRTLRLKKRGSKLPIRDAGDLEATDIAPRGVLPPAAPDNAKRPPSRGELHTLSAPDSNAHDESLSRNAVVPRAGLEPARPGGHQILSLTCLPIPPPRQIPREHYNIFLSPIEVAKSGIFTNYKIY